MTCVMAKRLRHWLKNNRILEKSQCGFRSRRATRDHLFALNSLIGNKLRRKGGKLYAAFVEFCIVFNTVNRRKMTEKLKQLGINGRILDMIVSIYKETTSEVIMQKGRTRRFRIDRGIKQECVQCIHRRSGEENEKRKFRRNSNRKNESFCTKVCG